MAITILPEDKGTYGSLGENIGGGLSNLLVGIAQGKAKQYKEGQTAQGLAPYFGEKLAKQLAPMDPLLLRELMKQKLQEPSRQAFAQAYSQMNGGGQGQGMQGSLAANMMGNGQQQQMTPEQQQEMAQQGMQQGQQGMQQPAQMTREDLVALEQMKAQRSNVDIKKEMVQEKRQQNIIQENAPWLKDVRIRGGASSDIVVPIDRAIDLLSNPQLKLGNITSLTQSRFSNGVTQEMASLLNQIVLKKSELGKGRPTEYKLKLEQLAKPQVWHKPKVLAKLLRDLKSDVSSDVHQERIADGLIEANNGFQPRGLPTKTKKMASLIKKIPAKVNEMPDGSIIETPGGFLQKQDGMWVPAKGE